MKIFGKQKEVLDIRRARGIRALFVSPEEHQILIKLETKDREKLELNMPIACIPDLIDELVDAYEAICPPMNRGRGNRASHWQGME